MGDLLVFILLNSLFYFFRYKKIKGNGAGDRELRIIYLIYLVYIFAYGIHGHFHEIPKLEPQLALTYIFFIGQGISMAIRDLVKGDFYLFDLIWLFLQGLFILVQRGSYHLVLPGFCVFLFFWIIERAFGGFGDGDKDYACALALACQSSLGIYGYLTSSFILAGAVGLVGLLCLGWTRDKKLPLGPFLMLGWILVNTLRWWKI